MNWEFGIDIYTRLILCKEQITKENLLYSIGNSTHCCGDQSAKEMQNTHTHTHGGHTNPL